MAPTGFASAVARVLTTNDDGLFDKDSPLIYRKVIDAVHAAVKKVQEDGKLCNKGDTFTLRLTARTPSEVSEALLLETQGTIGADGSITLQAISSASAPDFIDNNLGQHLVRAQIPASSITPSTAP